MILIVFVAAALPASAAIAATWLVGAVPGTRAVSAVWLPLVVVYAASAAFAYVIGRYVTDEFRRLQALSILVVDARDVESAASELRRYASFEETRTFVRTLSNVVRREREARERADRVAAYVAHDVRTPIAASGMALRSSLKAPTPSTVVLERVALELERVVQDLDLLVDSLRGAEGDPDAGGETGCSSVAQVVKRVQELVGDAFGATVEIEVFRDFATPVPERHVQRILENLVVNAARYGRGLIKVEVGSGIVRLHNEVAFEAMLSGGSAIPSSHGMGLDVVAHLLEQHRGKVTVEDRLDGSFAVIVYLPVATPASLG